MAPWTPLILPSKMFWSERPSSSRSCRARSWLEGQLQRTMWGIGSPVSRNQTRDYLDIAALADHLGIDVAAQALREIDEYYSDINQRDEAVSSQLARQLADPRPRDPEVTKQLSAYKGLNPRWHDWEAVRVVLGRIAQEMVS